MKNSLFVKTAVALALAAPLLASAESQLVVGPGSAVAHLDFRVIIPRVLFLAVGSGSGGQTSNGNIDQLTFDYTGTPADVGSGNPSTGQNVNVRVRGNNGQIALTAATTGALTNAATPADTIPWSEITVSSNLPGLPSPVIPATATGASSNVLISSGTKVTDHSAVWTYSYANSAVVAPGTYGTSTGNGRVIYTASMP